MANSCVPYLLRTAFFGVLIFVNALLVNAQTATVDGAISNPSQQILEHLQVRLERTPIDPLAAINGYLGTVLPGGVFHFDDIPPGDYLLSADADHAHYAISGAQDRNNFVHASWEAPDIDHPGRTIHLRRGDHIHGLLLELKPDSYGLCGRVVDNRGNPVTATVELYAVTHDYVGLHAVSPTDQPAQHTQADGSFRFSNLNIPGQYFPYFLRANGVWYPSSPSFTGARAVAATRPSAFSCHDIVLPAPGGFCYPITAKFASPPSPPLANFEATLFEVNPTDVIFTDQSRQIIQSGAVSFDPVCHGPYIIDVRDSFSRQYFDSPVFELNGVKNEQVVSLTTEQGLGDLVSAWNPPSASLEGKIIVENLTQDKPCRTGRSLSASLLRIGDMNAPIYGNRDSQGVLHFDQLRPGVYRLWPDFIDRGIDYLKSFTIDGHPVDPFEIHIAAGSTSTFEAVVSNDPAGTSGSLAKVGFFPRDLPAGTHPAASVSGKVTGELAEQTTVTLKAIRFNSAHSALYQTVAGPGGAFAFDSVQPGIYTLLTQIGSYSRLAYGSKGPGLEGTPIVLSAGQHLGGITIRTNASASESPPAKPGEPISGSEAHITITGRVLFDGNELPASLLRKGLQPQVRLTAIDSAGSFVYVPLDESGKFTIDVPHPGAYDVSIVNLNRNTNYVKSITVDGRSNPGPRLRFNAGQTADLLIEIGTDSAAVQAHSAPPVPPIDTWTDGCGSPPPDRSVQVFLIPEPLPGDDGGVLTSTFDQWDNSQFSSVPPGHYRIVAAENYSLEPPVAFRRSFRSVQSQSGTNPLLVNRDFLLRLSALGKPVEIKPGLRVDLEAPVVTEQVQDVLAELGVPRRDKN